MKKITSFILISLLVFLFVGCSNDDINENTVSNKIVNTKDYSSLTFYKLSNEDYKNQNKEIKNGYIVSDAISIGELLMDNINTDENITHFEFIGVSFGEEVIASYEISLNNEQEIKTKYAKVSKNNEAWTIDVVDSEFKS